MLVLCVEVGVMWQTLKKGNQLHPVITLADNCVVSSLVVLTFNIRLMGLIDLSLSIWEGFELSEKINSA